MAQAAPRTRPSNRHVVWTRRRSDGPRRGVVAEPLAAWAENLDLDCSRTKRVDHERGYEPRRQLRCVFHWAGGDVETLTMGDREWEVGAARTPGPFIEIDEQGMARVKTWDEEVVVELTELRIEGPSLVLEAEEFFGEKRLDARELVEPEPPADRLTSHFR